METPDKDRLDLREYLRVLIKRRWIIFSIFIVVVLTAAVRTFTAVPIYRSTARVVIEKENPNIVSFQEVMSMDAAGTDYYQTQYKIIESRNVAREVIQRLDLKNSPEFITRPRNDIFSKMKAGVRDTLLSAQKWVRSLLRSGDAGNRAVSPDEQDLSPDSPLVSAFIDRISVEPIQNSRLVDVSIEARDPVMAARMANALVRAYIDQNLETKLTAAKDAVKWLADRIEEERKKVEAAENALLQYKEEQEIITDFSSDAEEITAQKLASLNAQVVEAQAQRVEAETRYQQALALENSADMLDSVPEVLDNPLINEIKAMEVAIYKRMSELSGKYGKKHPQMVALGSELADLKKRKIEETRRVVNSLRNKYKLAVARETSLKKALEQQKAESLAMNRKAVRFGVLQRQAESSRHMYELLIRRFKETSLTEEMKTGNIRIIDRAEIPGKPVKPEKKKNLILATVIGLILGVGFAFFLEYLDNTIKFPDDIKDHLRIPYLGPVPAFSGNGTDSAIHPDLQAAHSPKSAASESFRGIRTAILFSFETAPQFILVTSAGPAEGKTVCAANLAVTMAQAGSKVLLLDCDMRRPRLHKIFNTPRDTGVSSVVTGQDKLNAVIFPSGIKNLDIVPVGPIPPNPSEILGSKNMVSFMEAVRKKYTRIIVDSPPLTAVTDAVVLAKSADGVLLVVRAADTPRQVVQNGLAQLHSVSANILGATLNGVNTGRDGYYYQYYYYYYGEDDPDKEKARPGKKG